MVTHLKCKGKGNISKCKGNGYTTKNSKQKAAHPNMQRQKVTQLNKI